VGMTAPPKLDGDALRAVQHRGSHLQIIAAAGSGKTEVVSQRVADLLADGIAANGIVAFTFTERAAEELKNRIALRVEQRLGKDALDRLGGLFIGTIHAYCFRLLQQHVPRYETYDVLDENQLAAFLAREANRLKIKDLDPNRRMFAAIKAFLHNVDVVENELLDPNSMPDPFGSVLASYLLSLDRYRLLSYGQQIARAVHELERPEIQEKIRADLRHLIVDEYQDVNPAQERLIELLTDPNVELCVVGDDDQAIYQWRGSDISNIVDFANRYKNVARFEITRNRRSLPQIIEVANRFGRSIPKRLAKTMGEFRTASPTDPRVVLWNADRELDEAGWIAKMIDDLHQGGVPYGDIAVLVRSSAAYPRLLEQFHSFDIPVQPGGRTGLFEQPEARVLGQTFCWLVDIGWREAYEWGSPVQEKDLLDGYQHAFQLDGSGRAEIRKLIRSWRDLTGDSKRTANLVGEIYALFDVLGVRSWDLNEPVQLNRVGTLARFTQLLADYESVRRRARPDEDAVGEQVGGEGRGDWYYKNLAFFILNHAQGAYDDFDGEPDYAVTGVDLTTVHRAKGLEWPVVFVPSLTKGRLPSRYAGSQQNWLVPRHMFAADRYEGSDGDERRLFYVAMTRARDWLSISRHQRVNVNRSPASPYYEELVDLEVEPGSVAMPPIEGRSGDTDEPITVSFSELSLFLDCALQFRLRNLLGFQPRLAPELGYGKAVHHVLRTVAEHTRACGNAPTPTEIDGILDASFFLPTANKPAHKQLKEAARRLVTEYTRDHVDDLHRVWETERPFELHLDGVIVNGRADVILDGEGGQPASYAILDYKTSTEGADALTDLQLQVYTDAGRREGLDVKAAYVHDLKAGSRGDVDVSTGAITRAETLVMGAAQRLRQRDYRPSPGKQCKTCEVRTVCHAAQR